MTTRDELLGAVAARYRSSVRSEKTHILDEFAAVTGPHRKHAARLLRAGRSDRRSASRPQRRLYDEAVREALIVLWEASDRICGKRLKALIPTLVPAMERHGHLALATEIRTALLAMSAATIDRALRPQRERIGARTRRRGSPSAIRRSIAVRTFSDWGDPPPGFVEADLVAHSGPVASGAFVQTLVLTDVAPGWTACAPLLVREQTLLVGVLTQLRRLMPFPLLGLDVDNDTVFMNETVRDYCQAEGIVLTRCQPYRKNDQAHIEQKNGCPARGRGGSPFWAARQRRSIEGWMPSSAATRISGRPLPCKRARASRLNSGVNSRLVFAAIGSPSSPLRSVSEVSTHSGEDHFDLAMPSDHAHTG